MEKRAQDAEEQRTIHALRIQELSTALENKNGSRPPSPDFPTSWADFTEWGERNFLGMVAFHSRAKREIKGAKLENIKLAATCIQWLANNYRRLRMRGGGETQDAEVTNGVINTQSGNDTFDIEWDGQIRSVDWHIKSGGNTRDPRRCLRIYYFWNEVSQEVVIARMPGHIRSQQS